MSLKEYRKKRNFARTAEPKGGARADSGEKRAFVVQKHDASRLHYDFRLEMEGTLKSWAVPKGPCLDPSQKRLAIQVEDHPIDYGDFEGLIPAGEYGGGTVMVWDRGTWQGSAHPEADYRGGELKFTLEGEKLKGSWVLVRTARGESRAPQWLLIKHRDRWAKPLAEYDILEKRAKSVKTGRTLDEIAREISPRRKGRAAPRASKAAPKKQPALKRKKTSRKTGRPKKSPARQPSVHRITAPAGGRRRRARLKQGDVPGASARPMPRTLRAELATLVARPPEGDAWLHEIKFDGYRMFCRLEKGVARFWSRNGQDWTARLASLSAVAGRLPADAAILDGEIVVLDSRGVSQFQLLQNAMGNQGEVDRINYYAFDLIYLDGFDLSEVKLEQRKSLLEKFLKQAHASQRIQYSDHVVGQGVEFEEKARQALLEGIVSKRRDSLYLPGRGMDWLKCKCRQTEEFVIGGYTRPAGSRIGFGALLLGYFQPDGRLVYAGRVGTGFDAEGLRSLAGRLKKIEQSRRPFAAMPPGTRGGQVHWVRPELVGQVEFANWTDAGLVRQASFLGLREDKPAREVTIEIPKNVSV